MFLMHLLLNTVTVLIKRKFILSKLTGDPMKIDSEAVKNIVSVTTLQQLKERVIGSYGSGGREKSIKWLSRGDIETVAHQLVEFVDDCF
jgi:hypothetical protein